MPGLAHLLDEVRGRCLLRLPIPHRGGVGATPGDDPQATDVALGDPVGRVSRQRPLVGLEGLAVSSELGKGLSQAVVGIGIAAELEDLLVAGDGRLPFTAGRLPDRDVGEVPALAVDGLRLVERHRLPELKLRR